MSPARRALVWAALTAAIVVPIAAAAMSPLLAWRQPVYIAAGFAGVIAMALLLVQPLLAAGYLPGLPSKRGRRVHRWTGGVLIAAVVAHVVGLWVTSPPDVVDALLFASPTPFSAWGVIAMWAVFGAALLAAFRARFPSEAAHMAPRPYCPSNYYRHRERGPCHADRRNNGDGVKNRALCIGPRGDGQGGG